ncbi:hypothetical protein TNCV_2136691 [Trichonephila clavipes]|nr:hypothetical protein TNCV_2136691 [Trichonephila clavipes]
MAETPPEVITALTLQAGLTCSHPRMPRAHQAGFNRRSLAGVGLFERVQSDGPGPALLTNGGVQQHLSVGSPLLSRKVQLESALSLP